MLGLTSPDDAWVAYCYDMAAARLGMWLESKLAVTDTKGRPKHRLSDLLAEPGRPRKRRASEYRTDFSRIPIDPA